MFSASFVAVGAAALYESFLAQATQQIITLSSTTSGSTTSDSTTPSGYVLVTPVSALSNKTSAYFTHPTYGSSILLNYQGQWRAFSAICTHAGCGVSYTGQSIYCPCHAGYFSATDGSPQAGPVSIALAEYGVLIQGSSLYVTTSRIN